MNCSGVGVLPPNCDQNMTASGSVEDIPTFIISAISRRTSLTYGRMPYRRFPKARKDARIKETFEILRTALLSA